MNRHPTVAIVTFAAMLIVVNFVVDVLYGAFPHNPVVAGGKQAITGA